MDLFIVFFTDELKMLDRVRVKIASFAAIIRVITQHLWRGALCDNPNKSCEED